MLGLRVDHADEGVPDPQVCEQIAVHDRRCVAAEGDRHAAAQRAGDDRRDGHLAGLDLRCADDRAPALAQQEQFLIGDRAGVHPEQVWSQQSLLGGLCDLLLQVGMNRRMQAELTRSGNLQRVRLPRHVVDVV